jgi:putative endopeptidase
VGYTAIGDVKVNGKLTLGENTADNGGLRIAHMALMEALKGKEAKPVDGFSPEQRLFLGWSQVWCMKITDEAARMRALTDPHSPGRYRVNGVVANMPEFAKAFSCHLRGPSPLFCPLSGRRRRAARRPSRRRWPPWPPLAPCG